GGEAIRVHFLNGGQKEHVAARRLQHLGVLRLLTRIAAQVLVRSELLRINENSCYNTVCPGLGGLDKREMTLMQSTHGRHQRNAQSGGSPVLYRLAQFR